MMSVDEIEKIKNAASEEEIHFYCQGDVFCVIGEAKGCAYHQCDEECSSDYGYDEVIDMANILIKRRKEEIKSWEEAIKKFKLASKIIKKNGW